MGLVLGPLIVGMIYGAVAVGAVAVGTVAIAGSGKKPLALPAPGEGLPEVPDPESIKKNAKELAKRRAFLKTRRILTSGAGVIDDQDESTLKKKTILGG